MLKEEKSVKMFNKKAQVTVFIIIGILVVAGVGALVYVNNVKDKNENLPPEAASFKVYMDECLNNGLENRLLSMGYQGGYSVPYDREDFATDFFGAIVPYYLYENENRIISKEEMISSIEQDAEEEITFCVDNFEGDIKIDLSEEKNIVVNLDDDMVSIKITSPVMITNKNNATAIISDFKTDIPVRLEKIYETTNEIVEIQEQDKYHICITCLEDLREKDMSIDSYNWENNTFVFMITDHNSITGKGENEKPYRFFFAIKYKDWGCESLPLDIDEYIKEFCNENATISDIDPEAIMNNLNQETQEGDENA